MTKTVTRFAPSPTGYLHSGNVRTALFNWLLAEKNGGAMQLRIEDTDRHRSTEEYAQAIIEDLNWLGLSFSNAENGKPWRQSQRTADYEQQFIRLRPHLYPCFCSDQTLAAERRAQLTAGKPPRYSGTCARLTAAAAQKRLSAGEPAAWRFRVPVGDGITVSDFVRGDTRYENNDIGDFIIRRDNGDFSFLFVNTVDDALLGITDVLRGEDHVANTVRQLMLSSALDFAPPRYGHIALMVGQDGKPLAKRAGLAALRDWRAQGYLPQAVLNYLARIGHTYPPDKSNQLMTNTELAQHFSTAALGRAPAQIDPARLRQWQKESVMQLTCPAYSRFLGTARQQRLKDEEAFFNLTRENVIFPEDSDIWLAVITEDTLTDISPQAGEVIHTAAADPLFYAAAADAATATSWQAFCDTVGKQCGKKGKQLFLPLRAALTGRSEGPAMPLVYALLSPATRRQRLEAAARSGAAARSDR